MSKHILIVDSEETIREIIGSVLVPAGYEYCEAVSGPDALAVLEREAFDLMLTSVLLMPDMDGFTLMGRTLQKYPKMIVVFVTAVSDPEIVNYALRSGARDYVMIPCPREEILAAVQNVLETPRIDGPY
jgi:CheY-like chemotaxis protein